VDQEQRLYDHSNRGRWRPAADVRRRLWAWVVEMDDEESELQPTLAGSHWLTQTGQGGRRLAARGGSMAEWGGVVHGNLWERR